MKNGLFMLSEKLDETEKTKKLMFEQPEREVRQLQPMKARSSKIGVIQACEVQKEAGKL